MIKKIMIFICLFVSFGLIAENNTGLYYQWPQIVIDAKYPVNYVLLGSDRANYIWKADTASLDYQKNLDKAHDQFKFLVARVKLAKANAYVSVMNLVSGDSNVCFDNSRVNTDILKHVDADYMDMN